MTGCPLLLLLVPCCAVGGVGKWDIGERPAIWFPLLRSGRNENGIRSSKDPLFNPELGKFETAPPPPKSSSYVLILEVGLGPNEAHAFGLGSRKDVYIGLAAIV